MFEEKIIKKIPGNPCKNPKEKQGYIEDLNSKSRVEILELLDRQNKILVNKNFVSKLPDKGERIRAFKKRLEEVLQKNNEVEEACALLSSLNISQRKITEDIEWTKESSSTVEIPEHSHKNSVTSDVEENESDPLKILASQGNVGTYKKKINRLLTEQDKSKDENMTEHCMKFMSSKTQVSSERLNLRDAAKKDMSKDKITSDKDCDELYAKVLREKIDTKSQENKKETFKPYCTNKSGVHPSLHIPKHRGDHWEVTAATPPLPVHGKTKFITLQESLHLQQAQATKLKEVQAKHASEKLAANALYKMGSTMPDSNKVAPYRDHPAYDSCNSSDEERHSFQSDDDENEYEKQDTIVYSYTE